MKPEVDDLLIALPPGYKAKADIAVGISYYDEKGQIIFQHPKDSNLARIGVWNIFEKREKAAK